jgi:hypothetical protein
MSRLAIPTWRSASPAGAAAEKERLQQTGSRKKQTTLLSMCLFLKKGM